MPRHRPNQSWRELVCSLWISISVQLNAKIAPTTAFLSTTTSSLHLPKLKAAVFVPGFLTGENDFRQTAEALTARGIPTIVVPMPNWHWLSCLGGRSVRPMLERLDYTVRHLAASGVGGDGTVSIPRFGYTAMDLYADFRHNPGGIYRVGGTDKVVEYPLVEPRGKFLIPDKDPQGSIALIGHSAGGWISRIYLSERAYGGRAYRGKDLVHSLVTLGTPHMSAPGFAFESLNWCNEESDILPVRQLAVGGVGFPGDQWGDFTAGSYAFCCEKGGDGLSYDGDGVTPIHSSLALPGADQLILQGVHHFCWSDVFGGKFVAPELTEDYKRTRLWYGSESALDQWASFLEDI